MKTVAIHTLGCRANQLESAIIADKFLEYGWKVVNFTDFADVYIINTCTVTGKSDSTSRYYIRKAKTINTEGKIVVTGCYSQVAPDEVAKIEGVDLVLGNTEKIDIAEMIVNQDILAQNDKKISVSDIMKEDKFRDKTVLSARGRVRATIKIQDGCNFRCSYCIIPYARGKSRSCEFSGVMDRIKEITDRGFKEVVFSGIHLGQWGIDLKPKNNLAGLLSEVEKTENLHRYRLSSIDPIEFTDELVEILANSKKFCRHLHISLQSGNNEILAKMKRRYTVEEYSQLITKLAEKIPFINIGSDIIVGFPGETEESFLDTCENLDNLPIGYIHVFTYSQRNGTPAATLPEQVDERIKKQRNAGLKQIALAKNRLFRQKMLGNEFEIIVENSRDRKTGFLKGMTDNFVPVLLDGPDGFKNQAVKVKISNVEENSTYSISLQKFT